MHCFYKFLYFIPVFITIRQHCVFSEHSGKKLEGLFSFFFSMNEISFAHVDSSERFVSSTSLTLLP